jgi:vacuolar-type H+-ATPase subunit H
MATEIVNVITKAESDAQKAEEQAAAQCDAVLRDARKQAAEKTDAMLKQAKQKAQTLLAEADKSGKEIEKGAQAEIASQIESMRQKALQRRDEAVRLVLSELV